MEKFLDAIADSILNFGPWLLSLFGDRDEVKAIQEKVVEFCGFLPTATSVAAMVQAGPITGVLAIATAICTVASGGTGLSLVSTKPSGTVNGIKVEGQWVK